MSTAFKNKNSLRAIEAQIVQKLKNNEARQKFSGSYKNKSVYEVLRPRPRVSYPKIFESPTFAFRLIRLPSTRIRRIRQRIRIFLNPLSSPEWKKINSQRIR